MAWNAATISAAQAETATETLPAHPPVTSVRPDFGSGMAGNSLEELTDIKPFAIQ